MKALTIWQPWASLIMAGAKPYEFRGWRVPPAIIGQRIVIHAAARKIDWDEVSYLFNVHALRDTCDRIALAAAETCLVTAKAIPVLNRALQYRGTPAGLPMAYGLGTAIIGEPRLGTEIAAEFGVPRANDSTRDEHANWGWPLTEIEAWPTPIPMRGAQGFWTWPDPASAGLI
jgi:hypothetical protein